MRRKIFRTIFTSLLLATLLTASLVFGILYMQFYSEMKSEVKREAAYINAGYSISGEDFLKNIEDASSYSNELSRITLIAPEGTVLFDNYALADEMENHADRPEIRKAILYGSGEATRLSDTIGQQTFYHALRLPDGSVLRVARTTASVFASAASCIPYLIAMVILIAVLSMFIAKRRTRGIIDPINNLDLDDPLSNEVYEELAPLLIRIAKQRRDLEENLREISRRQEEFETITGNLSEGLILLNGKGSILSVNPAAARLFDIDPDKSTGRDILTVCRSLQMQKLLHDAILGKRSETSISIGGGQYQMIASPVESHGLITGVVLLTLDVTEKFAAEKLRREFTANVSHELKTPLQSISGYAEIIQNGLVKPEDMPRFIGQIYSESQRLISLVEDIIRLSRLDEGGEMQREESDLFDLANKTVSYLSPSAKEASVTLETHGESVVISGVPQLLGEIIYNLCENAIKYNRPGGRVDVSVESRNSEAVLKVRDTGIGITKEHQSRIFERFYRV
ncbi:MAG: histidine kinase dimerization/phospho-acceptor domain-containing protein, partial [Oscillospiraceae bacterium]